MNKLALLFVALLLTPASAVPQMSYATPALTVAAGVVTVAQSSGFHGLQKGTGPCNGLNVTFGTWQASGVDQTLLPLGLDCMNSLSASWDMRVGLSGARPQNFFSYIRAVDCDGNVRIFLSSAATYETAGSDRRWTWGAGASMVFELPCTAGTAQIVFVR